MGISGLLIIIIGLMISGSGIGIIFGIPIILVGIVVCVLAIIKGGLSALFRLGGGRRD